MKSLLLVGGALLVLLVVYAVPRCEPGEYRTVCLARFQLVEPTR